MNCKNLYRLLTLSLLIITPMAVLGDEQGFGRMASDCVDTRVQPGAHAVGKVHSVSISNDSSGKCSLKIAMSLSSCGKTRYIISVLTNCAYLDSHYKLALSAYATNTSLIVPLVAGGEYLNIDLSRAFTITRSY